MTNRTDLDAVQTRLLNRVQRWCTEPADDDDLQDLIALRTQLELLEYVNAERELTEHAKDLLNRSAFRDFESVAVLPMESVCRVLTHPVALLWSKATHFYLQCVKGLASTEDGTHPVEMLRRHLNGFAPLSIAAHALCGQECTSTDVQLPERFSFPGLGILAQRKSTGPIALGVRQHPEGVTIWVGGTETATTIPPRRGVPHPLRVQGEVDITVFPEVPNEGAIAFEFAEPVLRFHFPLIPPGTDSEIDLPLWTGKLQRTFDLIQQVWPEMYAELLASLSVLVPTSVGMCQQHATGTNPTAWRAIGTNLFPDPYLADGMIHEHRHGLLHTLSHLDALVETNTARLFSPWRTDARPANGVFHAVFVFTAVAEFYRRVLMTSEWDLDVTPSVVAESLGLQVLNLRVAIEELRARAAFSEFGGKLLDVLSDEAERLYREAAVAGAFESSRPAAKIHAFYDDWCRANQRAAMVDVHAIVNELGRSG